jgi:hypothetical protein
MEELHGLDRDIPYLSLVEIMTPYLHSGAIEELVVIAFHLRNIRGGKGLRQLFRDMMSVLYDYDRVLVTLLLPLIPEYGYWKDVFCLSMSLPHLLEPTLRLCTLQLLEDERRVSLGLPPSLLAKYIPKEKKKYKGFASSFARYLYPEIQCHSLRMAKTRKRISALNVATLEVTLCKPSWASIEPSAIPVLAREKYRLALMNEVRGGAIRSIAGDRIACREKFMAFLAAEKVFTEPIVLTTASEKYAPVRRTVEFWRTNRLNV